MLDITSYFSSFDALDSYTKEKKKGELILTYRNSENYEGMVLAIMIIFDTDKSQYRLDLQWMSLGLDFYGDTLQESYVYQFNNLAEMMAYILATYQIHVTTIPIKYQFDYTKHPSPIIDEDKKSLYKKAWEQFQQDFKAGLFLDKSLMLI